MDLCLHMFYHLVFQYHRLISLITKTERIKPITKDPVSPINILAGLKLNFRNANNEPTRVKERIASGYHYSTKNSKKNKTSFLNHPLVHQFHQLNYTISYYYYYKNCKNKEVHSGI